MEEVEDYNEYEESINDDLHFDPHLPPPKIKTGNYLRYLEFNNQPE